MYCPFSCQCPPGTAVYTVKAGDSLYAISLGINIPIPDLLAANPGIRPDRIFIRQNICIPLSSNCSEGKFSYTSGKGDSLFLVSRKFGVSFEALKKANPGIKGTLIAAGLKIYIPGKGRRYHNPEYNIEFFYPLNWRRINEDRYEGTDGFFQVSAIEGVSLDEVCRNEAFHILKPYGSQPYILRFTLNRQEACYIFPSQDQPEEMRNQAALVVRYPKPVQIAGQSYNFLALWADKQHIRELAATVVFPAG